MARMPMVAEAGLPSGKMVLAWHTNIAARRLDLQQWCLFETDGSSFSGSNMGDAFYRTNGKEG